MNNQKVTKLSAKHQEIATLKKELSFTKGRLQYTDDLLRSEMDKSDNVIIKLSNKYEIKSAELNKIKSHWLYKLINWLKK